MSAPKIRRRGLVRGTARRVVIVPQPDGGAFEQAIFIVRGECSVSADELLREALKAAGAEPGVKLYPRQRPSRRWKLRRAMPWILTFLASGAAALAAVLIW